MLAKELEGEGGVGDYGAALLLDCLADHSGALDVAGLSFADSEDVGDALDAVYVSRRAVVLLASSGEGFLYGLVDYLCELCYGEVNDSGVWIHAVLSFVCLETGEGVEPSSSSCRVCDVAVEGLYLLSYPVGSGEGLLAFLPG